MLNGSNHLIATQKEAPAREQALLIQRTTERLSCFLGGTN